MLPRILRDPAPTEGAGGAIATPPPAETTATPPPAEKPAEKPAASASAQPPTVTIPADEWARFRVLDEQHRATLEEAEQLRIKAIAEKDGFGRAIEEERRVASARLAESVAAERKVIEARLGEAAARHADEKKTLGTELSGLRKERDDLATRLANLESLYHGTEKSRAVSDALAGYKFVSPEAAGQVRQLLAPLFVTKPGEGGAVTVATADGKSPADAVKEALATASYSHFLEPGSRGGAGATGGTTRPTSPADPNAAKVAEMADRMKQIFAPVPNGLGRG